MYTFHRLLYEVIRSYFIPKALDIHVAFIQECFLKVCQQLEIEPLIVIVPVNGYYYDFTGFPKEARQNYYEKVRTLAESYGARIADFSDQEYTKYFFEDRVHLVKKGWVMVDESLYNYYKEA